MASAFELAIVTLFLGAVSLFLGWIPIIGWIILFLSFYYGRKAAKQCKEENNRIGQAFAIIGIMLFAIGLFFAIMILLFVFIMPQDNSKSTGLQLDKSLTPKGSSSASASQGAVSQGAESKPAAALASATDEQGLANMKVSDSETLFQFTDENGLPISGLSVGIGLTENQGKGVLVVIDPSGNYSPQLIMLEPEDETDTVIAGSNNITGNVVEAVPSPTIETITLSKDSASAIPIAKISTLKKVMTTTTEVMSAIVFAGKFLDQITDLKLGEYAGKLNLGEKKLVTQEEADVEHTVFNTIKKKIFFLVPETIETKNGVVKGLSPIGVGLETAIFIADELAISACGLPNDKVEVIDWGFTEIFNCKHMYISDYIPWPVTVEVEPKDKKSSLTFISKDHLGLAFTTDTDNGNKTVEIPKGDYTTKISSDGFQPEHKDFGKNDNKLKLTLKPIDFPPTGTASQPIKFTSNGALPSATVGEEYSYSFCEPELSNTSDLCGGFGYTSNPADGIPPYHFTLGSGVGFPPMGLTLNSNGMLKGTPSAKGQSTFSVCAVDIGGFQSCQTFTLEVSPPSACYWEELDQKPAYAGQPKCCQSHSWCNGPDNCCEENGCVCEGETSTQPEDEKPKTEYKAETWTGTATGNYVIDTYCGVEDSIAEFGYTFNITFTFPVSVVEYLNDSDNEKTEMYEYIYQHENENTGTLSETTTVLQQIQTSSYYPDCFLAGGSINTAITVSRGWGTERYLDIHGANGNQTIAGIFQKSPELVYAEPKMWGSLELNVKEAGENSMSGTWGTGQFGEGLAHGTFTLTKTG